MPSYINSSNNRFYVTAEDAYGSVTPPTSTQRIPSIRLKIRQKSERLSRRDKTGSRTFPGLPAGVRKQTDYSLLTYMTTWTNGTPEPSYGPLIRAAMGAPAESFAGGTVRISEGKQITFAAPHGLRAGQAVAIGDEIRFATNVPDSLVAIVNAPFTGSVTGGTKVLPTVTYRLASDLPSISVFDFWGPESSVQRILTGAAVNRMVVKVNGDFHEFEFSGAAADVIDNTSFVPGSGGLQTFPGEPTLGGFDYSIIPGHLGQAWLGSAPDRLYTLTGAEISLDNGIELRGNEFGSDLPLGLTGGIRDVTATFSVFAANDDQTRGLYQASRQQSPVALMLQLGQRPRQLAALLLQGMVPQVPEFDDNESRLKWKLNGCRAQGVDNDEIVLAFA